MTKNDTQKNLIKILTETHQDPIIAYHFAILQAKTAAEAETLRRIARALNVKI